MATWRWLRPILREPVATFTRLRSTVSPRRLSPGVLLGLGVAGAGAVLGGSLVFYNGGRRWWSGRGLSRRYSVYAAEQQVQDPLKENAKEACGCATTRKQRFRQFASIEYEGELYMTPRDFVYSVTLENMDNGGNFLSGLISYTEYLFLLGILTKPHTGFRFAFSMLDTDGNQQVEKKEFLVLQSIIGQKKEAKLEAHSTLEGSKEINTTLLVHFFGKEGKLKLQYSDFYRFMKDLQTEVQEIEFREFSRGMKTMRREEFAAWLLHFTEEQNRAIYWKNARMRIPPGESISFEEFRAFCQFMNHLEDFAITMNMFTTANRPVGIGHFKRAVKVVTGQELSDNVLDTVFKIFDLDGDGCLSKQEFLGVIMTRLHRGLKEPTQHGFKGYFKCVKKETIVGVHEAWKQSGKSPC
ncbi:calcium uptake protein 2, mitochondrial isoform X2 [Heptranchias perlo]|uniref:calcium uptake protein 2, mitochondrial isoform X2 n=1 Tax=Heptranchias perlo TaxID=212740 RepID=UPI00355ACD82